MKEGGWGTGESGVEWLIRSPCSMDFSRNRYQQQSMSRERRTSSQCSFTVQLQAVCSTAAVLPTLLLMFRATGFFFYACACVWIDCHYRSALGTVLNEEVHWFQSSVHTPSIAFRHLPPNSARFSYATEGALFISAQLSTDAGGALRKVRILIRLQKQPSAQART